MRCIYFVRERRAGSNLIKIGKTDYCPYLRLDELRRANHANHPYSRYELLGVIEGSDADKHTLQGQFEGLRKEGDWFRPGLKLVEYIRDHTHPHFCDRSCPDGPAIEEEMRMQDAEASEAVRRAFS